MRWCTNSAQHAYMRRRVDELRERGPTAAERWAWKRLRAHRKDWVFQFQWGCRVFDFWLPQKGVAVEVDGPEHNPIKDAIRDKYALIRSEIIVLRVPNFDEQAMSMALIDVSLATTWKIRRKTRNNSARKRQAEELGLLAHGKWTPPVQQ